MVYKFNTITLPRPSDIPRLSVTCHSYDCIYIYIHFFTYNIYLLMNGTACTNNRWLLWGSMG